MSDYRNKLEQARSTAKAELAREQAEKELIANRKKILDEQKKAESEDKRKRDLKSNQIFDETIRNRIQSMCSQIAKENGLNVKFIGNDIYLGTFGRAVESSRNENGSNRYLAYVKSKKEFSPLFMSWIDVSSFTKSEYWTFTDYVIGVRVHINNHNQGFDITVGNSINQGRYFSASMDAISKWSTDELEQEIISKLAQNIERNEKIILWEGFYADKSGKTQLEWCEIPDKTM